MNQLLSIFLVIALIMGCSAQESQTGSFGEKITKDEALSLTELTGKVATDGNELECKIQGKVEAVCKVKGCWMTLVLPNDESMRVTFKDYGFFVPKEIEGKTAYARGVARYDTTSVADLRHFAEDEGLSQEEIEKITEPEVELVFVADGVIIE